MFISRLRKLEAVSFESNTLMREGNMLSLLLTWEPRTQDGSGVAGSWFSALCFNAAQLRTEVTTITRKTKALGAVPNINTVQPRIEVTKCFLLLRLLLLTSHFSL